MLNYKPIVQYEAPENPIRAFCFVLVEKPGFDLFIIVCIILNSICLGLQWYSEDPMQTTVIDTINLIFTIVFTLEAVLKLVAMKSRYFASGSN
jgi:hypothetical protein